MRTIRELALTRGPIAALAEEMGVARPPLSEALHGRRAAAWSYWFAVGRALGFSRDELLDALGADEADIRANSFTAKT